MGLFDFFKKAGAKANTDANKTTNNTPPPVPDIDIAFEEKLKTQKKNHLTSLVNSLGLNIKDFDVDYNDNKATVYGQVESDEIATKILSVLNKADGINYVDNRISVVPPAMSTYVVKKGDSLSKIAQELYGDPMKYKEIAAANPELIKDPNMIHAGWELKIPKL